MYMRRIAVITCTGFWCDIGIQKMKKEYNECKPTWKVKMRNLMVIAKQSKNVFHNVVSVVMIIKYRMQVHEDA